MIMKIFLQFVYMVDYIERFSYIEPSLHLCDEVHLMMVNDLFNVILDSVFVFLSIFVSVFVV